MLCCLCLRLSSNAVVPTIMCAWGARAWLPAERVALISTNGATLSKATENLSTRKPNACGGCPASGLVALRVRLHALGRPYDVDSTRMPAGVSKGNTHLPNKAKESGSAVTASAWSVCVDTMDAFLATWAQSSFVSTAIYSVASGLDLKVEHRSAALNAHHAREDVSYT